MPYVGICDLNLMSRVKKQDAQFSNSEADVLAESSYASCLAFMSKRLRRGWSANLVFGWVALLHNGPKQAERI